MIRIFSTLIIFLGLFSTTAGYASSQTLYCSKPTESNFVLVKFIKTRSFIDRSWLEPVVTDAGRAFIDGEWVKTYVSRPRLDLTYFTHGWRLRLYCYNASPNLK